jgi:hypothetical protein
MKQDDDSKQQEGAVYNQYAMILNYKPHIEHQHIHMNGDTDSSHQESDADAEFRKRLMATNIVIRTQTPSGKLTVDLLKLHRFIDKYFVSEIQHKYEWYALKRFLEKYNLLRECDNVQFAKQMNSSDWFGKSDYSCEANEMNYYNYLNGINPDRWIDTEIQLGSRATSRSVDNIYRKYSNLDLYKDQLIGL